MKITQTLSSYGFQQVLFTFDPVGQKLEVIDSHLHADRKTNFGLAVNSRKLCVHLYQETGLNIQLLSWGRCSLL